MGLVPQTEKSFKVDGAIFVKDILPIWFISHGKDYTLTCKDGKCFNEVYRLVAEKGGKVYGEVFRPDFPEDEAIRMVLDAFKK